MRSTQTSDPTRVHSVSWHLMRCVSARSRRYPPSHSGKQSQKFEASRVFTGSMYRALRVASVSDV